MTKRILAFLVAVILMAVTFTGCLEEDEPKTTGDEQGSESSPVSDSGSGHKHVFSGEDDESLEISFSSHTFTCAECGKVVKEKHEYKYVSDVNGHHKECVCKKTQGEYSDHIMSKGKCTKCGWQEDPNHTHSFTVGEQIDDSYHSVSCQCGRNEKKLHESTICLDSETDMHYYSCVCGWKSEQFPHYVVIGVCIYCDEMGVTHYCDFNKKGYDEDGHFLECECGERMNYVSHNCSTYDGKPYMIDEIYHSVKCEDCDYVYSEKHSYVLVDGYCGSCGHQKPESVGLEFEENGGSYTVIGLGSCTDTYIVIPAKHNGKPVTAIGSSAFEGNTNIVCVVAPDGVTVGSSAFAGCTSLEAAKLPGETVIRDNAFMGCTSLEFVDYGVVLRIEMFAFTGCKSLKGFTSNYRNHDYYVMGGYVGDYAFKDCTALAIDLEIYSDGDTYIGAGAFSGTSIKSLLLSAHGGVLTLGGGAFSGCKSLKTVTVMNDSIEYFEIGTFSNCTALEKLRVGYGDKEHYLDFFAESTVDEEMGLSWYDGCPDFTVEFVDSPPYSDEEIVVESIKISALYDYINETYWQ